MPSLTWLRPASFSPARKPESRVERLAPLASEQALERRIFDAVAEKSVVDRVEHACLIANDVERWRRVAEMKQRRYALWGWA